MLKLFKGRPKLRDNEQRWAGKHYLVFEKIPIDLTIKDLATIAQAVERDGDLQIVFRFSWRKWNQVSDKEYNERMMKLEQTLSAALLGLGLSVQVWTSDGPGWGPPADREYVSVARTEATRLTTAC
jgi:hypothetical protein